MENGGGQGDGCEERANAVFPKLEVQKKLFGTGIGVAEVTLGDGLYVCLLSVSFAIETISFASIPPSVSLASWL